MYYPQQSPGTQKLPPHHDQNNPWNRHLGVGVNPQAQPPTSPGYMYTNGALMGPHHMAPMQHHHQNSLGHFPSPPNHQQQSPAAQPMSREWQQQLMKYETMRTARSPHHRARANAVAARGNVSKTITITNPNQPDPSKAAVDDTPPSPSMALSMAVNHPSSTTAPTLDMGGINIKCIPPSSGLFSFAFLTALYLNHNALTSVPPEISKLRHLEVLDLSANNLSTLPIELGLLINLKEFLLFDNHLSTIPPEFGTLHRLKTLGIEGNPLDTQLKSLLQKDGTVALISYLRDNAPMGLEPPPRPLIHLNPIEPGAEIVKVISYNILCERAATTKMYGYTPTWALAWDYRKNKVMQEVVESKADIVCLQEVDIGQYEEFFSRHLTEMGYEGVYGAKSRYKTMQDSDRRQVDGCATFFKKDRYQLVENHLIEFNAIAMQRQDFKKTDDMFNRVLGKDHIGVIVLLEDLVTGSRIIVSNTHLHWDALYSDVKLVQTALLLEEVEKIAHGFAKYPQKPPDPPIPDDDGIPPRPPQPTYPDGTKIPLLVCGDFNSIPSSGVYDFLSTGTLPATHPDFLLHTYGTYTSEGLRHKLGLKSAYTTLGSGGVPEEIMPVTNVTAGFRGILDYVWYTPGNLILNTVVGEIDKGYLEKIVGFPNPYFPSDHIPLTATLTIKAQREMAPRPPPPVFS
ncbi:Endonuclease/exonuclease/phosphatase [Favolaschia claudopus]|uniref:CCR4-Not complex 3'-5'-exoribonuclease subunit Ccr4 n=1 Tax=Favolaschia claudopus TaxID=2862362 RepID=A0AAW0A9P0_9AGAR